ncbi:MAG: hypothetical protein WC244_03265 [Patescibacteria group bacterium]|jgi:hypothetical protein
MNQKTFVKIILILGIIILICVVGYFVFAKQSAPQDETANWKTYTNTRYGYSIKFPMDFKAEEQGMGGNFDAKPDSPVIFISNNKLELTINPNILSSEESEIKGITVDKGFGYLARSAEINYANQEFVKFSYLKKSYPFAELAGYMEGTINNTKGSKSYGDYYESYHLQTKHNSQFLQIDYRNVTPKANRESAEFQTGLDKLEKIITTIEFTKK